MLDEQEALGLKADESTRRRGGALEGSRRPPRSARLPRERTKLRYRCVEFTVASGKTEGVLLHRTSPDGPGVARSHAHSITTVRHPHQTTTRPRDVPPPHTPSPPWHPRTFPLEASVSLTAGHRALQQQVQLAGHGHVARANDDLVRYPGVSLAVKLHDSGIVRPERVRAGCKLCLLTAPLPFVALLLPLRVLHMVSAGTTKTRHGRQGLAKTQDIERHLRIVRE